MIRVIQSATSAGLGSPSTSTDPVGDLVYEAIRARRDGRAPVDED